MKCHSCGDTFEKIVTHWARSSCNHPSISDEHMEILIGVLMGDGTIYDKFDDNRNPRFRVYMTNREYLEYLSRELNTLTTSNPQIHRTSQELADSYSEFSESNNPDDYKEQYRLQTISHPSLRQLEKWYQSGEKVYPEDLYLSETILKNWYVCDGSFNNNGYRSYIEIHLSNERENKGKIERYFSRIGHPISRWRDDEQENGHYKTSIIFNKSESNDLFRYMGKPLPGFEYKWP